MLQVDNTQSSRIISLPQFSIFQQILEKRGKI